MICFQLFWFQDGLLNKFVEWSETSKEPLRSYATGLLAAAMEVQDIADTQREANVRLVSYSLAGSFQLETKLGERKITSDDMQGCIEMLIKMFDVLVWFSQTLA